MSMFTDPIKVKMAPSWLSIFLFIACSSIVPSVVAQFGTSTPSSYLCDKYCFADCSNYFPGSEFSSCVTANVHCPCHSKMTTKNPMLIIVIVFVSFLFITVCGCGMCRYCKQNGRSSSHRVIAHPIVSTVTGHSASNNNNRTNHNNNSPQRGAGGYVNPLAPQKSNDIPPEYMAPPPYNECVLDINPVEGGMKERIVT